MTDTKMIGWRASPEDAALVDEIREQTDESSRSAVIRKAVRSYARALKVAIPA